MRYFYIIGKKGNAIMRFTGVTFHMYMGNQLGWVEAGVDCPGIPNALGHFEKWEITEAEFRRLIFMESI